MKSVLFDVDGVFLSEERCFDVSALTVYELLMDQMYLGLKPDIDLSLLKNEDIARIRSDIFVNDEVLKKLKSLGLNSNWDMLYIVFSLHFIQILKELSSNEVEKILQYQQISGNLLQEIGQLIKFDDQIDYPLPLKFLEHVESGKSNIFTRLQDYARNELNTNQVSFFEFKSPLWQLTQSIYQEWYLGSELFKDVEGYEPYKDNKSGFIHHEILLRPIKEIQHLLNDLQDSGYQIAIATGRPRTETLVPFESLNLLSYFDEMNIVTASEVLKSETMFPEYKPLGKPNPFSYIATLNGNKEEEYFKYITHQNNIVKKEEVFIVGDSLADLLSAKKIGATFIGTLTGLKGENAKKELENNGADYIVNHVGNIRDILL
ncbi:phosphoglycolate phosphatase [Mycobacteroides abscessus subsp. abscessus]|nr:phosphoglycolate phosphatase [Mycobacteroides abscessus subsp. abscessus]